MIDRRRYESRGFACPGQGGANDVHPPMTLVLGEPVQQASHRRLDDPLDDGPIALFHRTLAKLLGQSRGGLRRASEEHYACDRGIQPTDHAQIDVARLLIAIFHILLGERQERRPTARRAHRRQPSRL